MLLMLSVTVPPESRFLISSERVWQFVLVLPSWTFGTNMLMKLSTYYLSFTLNSDICRCCSWDLLDPLLQLSAQAIIVSLLCWCCWGLPHLSLQPSYPPLRCLVLHHLLWSGRSCTLDPACFGRYDPRCREDPGCWNMPAVGDPAPWILPCLRYSLSICWLAERSLLTMTFFFPSRWLLGTMVLVVFFEASLKVAGFLRSL